MKTRNNLVSNSSSTSYVVYIPQDLDPKTLIPDDFEYLYDNENVDIQECKKIMEDMIMNLKNGHELWCGNEEVAMIYTELLEATGPFVLASIQTGPDDGGLITGVAEHKIKKLLGGEY